MYVAIITGSCANYAATPLFYELAAEVAFPVDEVIVGGFMSCIYNLVGAVFLFAFFIPNIGESPVIFFHSLAGTKSGRPDDVVAL